MTDKDQLKEEVSSGSDSDLDMEPEFPTGAEHLVFGSMLNDILGNYFEYIHEGTSLNLADILLLTRETLVAQNKLLEQQTQLLSEVVKQLNKKN